MSRRSSMVKPSTPKTAEVEGQSFSDPFDIPADLSPKIRPEHYPWIFGVIRARYGRMIKRALRQPGTGALLLCDRKVVATAEWSGEFDLERIHRIEREHGRVCFIYGTGDLVEEGDLIPLGVSHATSR